MTPPSTIIEHGTDALGRLKLECTRCGCRWVGTPPNARKGRTLLYGMTCPEQSCNGIEGVEHRKRRQHERRQQQHPQQQ